jgi:hypothetical protein
MLRLISLISQRSQNNYFAPPSPEKLEAERKAALACPRTRSRVRYCGPGMSSSVYAKPTRPVCTPFVLPTSSTTTVEEPASDVVVSEAVVKDAVVAPQQPVKRAVALGEVKYSDSRLVHLSSEFLTCIETTYSECHFSTPCRYH